MSDPFESALTELQRSGHRLPSLSGFFVELFPVTGAAVSTVGDLLGSETISATDDTAARLDELQFDLGEGPCWDAMRSVAAVIEPEFRLRGVARWPAFAAATEKHAVASMFAFPLSVGELTMGAVDLYSSEPVTLSPAECAQAITMAEVVGRHVLRDALSDFADRDARAGLYSRRTIHQATGIVLAQLDISPDDALLMIQARAFSTGQRMMEVAQAIVDGSLRFTRATGGIEAQS
ncbi:GAF and ANTAR domain-containing protein [Microbacterium sp. 3J1]|uniref:GAF and ANTAR domain-containing protein n=1 Tax=Microbacterium sp. 3J1 TaxID=861269 RepID=UPI000A686D20|nr:GAF and ANTAR domain-containing protein [Microbacterium sp. 3J1]